LYFVALTTLSYDFHGVEDEKSRYYNALEVILEEAFAPSYHILGRVRFLFTQFICCFVIHS
jgi:hypothetical protein